MSDFLNVNIVNTDLAKLVNKIKGINSRIDKATRLAMFDIVDDLRNNIMLSMKNTKKGPPRGAKGHRSSLPGNPPAVDSGRLFNSIDINIGRTSFEVGTDISYAPIMEFGTKKKNYPIKVKTQKSLSDGINFFGRQVIHPGIHARPFLKPVADSYNPIPAIMDRLKEIKR